MKFTDIPSQLRDQTFPPTGGRWVVHDPHLIEIILGPNIADRQNVIAEARWAENLFHQLKALDSGQRWDAITSLENLPKQDTPPLTMRIIYANMIRDPQTRYVSIVHATGWNKAITKHSSSPWARRIR